MTAATKLSKQNDNIKFVFLGEGRARKHLIEKAEETGVLNKTVFFLGRFPIESMPFFMGKSSVLLVSLKNELIFNLTVPSKVQFYMAQGKPLLAMLNGDGADLINEASCGIAVPANDIDSFITAIKKMSSMDKDQLDLMGKNGKKYYEENFMKEYRINQLDELLKNGL